MFIKMKESGFSVAWVSVFVIMLSTLTVITLRKNSIILDRYDVTTNHLQKIEKALTAFLLKNKRLPCPASLGYVYTDAEFGNEIINEATGYCKDETEIGENEIIKYGEDVIIGAVPAKTLEIPMKYSMDGWGNKILYVVDNLYTLEYDEENPDLNISGWKDGVGGNIIIKYDSKVIESEGIYLLISYSSNDEGSFGVFDTRQKSLPTDIESLDNVYQESSIDNIFKLNTNDILLYHNSNQARTLINRFDSN